MQLPGSILKKHREELSLSLQELENLSKLPRRSLEALENDQYDYFASESYYLRFLKCYAENLKLDPKILLNAYQNVKIIESPLPIEQLTGKQKKNLTLPILLVILLLFLVVAAGTYWLVRQNQSAKASTSPKEEQSASSTLVIVDRYPWLQELKDGLLLRLVLDSSQEDLLKPELRITEENGLYQLVSQNLEQEYRLILAPGKTNSLPLHSESKALVAYRLDFSLQSAQDAEGPSVLIRLQRRDVSEDLSNLDDKFQAFERQSQKALPYAILQAAKPIALQLQLSFQRDSYIRYQWFGKEAQEFPVLKNKQLLLQGDAPFTLWLSDVQATGIKINGQNLVPDALRATFENVFIGHLEWRREGNVARLYLTPGQ